MQSSISSATATLRRVMLVSADRHWQDKVGAWAEAAGFEVTRCGSTAEVAERYAGEAVVIADDLGEGEEAAALVAWLQHARIQGSPWIGFWMTAKAAGRHAERGLKAEDFLREQRINSVIPAQADAQEVKRQLESALVWLGQEPQRRQLRVNRPRRALSLEGLTRRVPPQLPGTRRQGGFLLAAGREGVGELGRGEVQLDLVGEEGKELSGRQDREGREGVLREEKAAAGDDELKQEWDEPGSTGVAGVEAGQGGNLVERVEDEESVIEKRAIGEVADAWRGEGGALEQKLATKEREPSEAAGVDGPGHQLVGVEKPESVALPNGSAEGLAWSQETAQLWAELAPTPQVLLDAELRVLAATRSWCGLFRLGSEAATGRLLTDLVPEKAEVWRRGAAEALAGRGGEPTQELIRHGDGSCDWVRWQMQPWRGPRAEITALVLTCELTTVQVERERQLRTPFEMGLSLLAETHLALIALDLQGRIMRLNAGAEDLLGGAAEAGAELVKLLPLADPAGWRAGFVAAGEELARSGQFAFARRIELRLASGLILPGLQMPWADEESFVRGVLLMLWPAETGGGATAEPLARAEAGSDGQVARAEVYPSAELLPTLLSWPAAVFSAEGSERKANRAWRALPAGLSSHWPQPGDAGTAAGAEAGGEAAVTEGQHPGVLMVPLGREGLESWLAIAPPGDSGRGAPALTEKVGRLQEQVSRSGEERVRREAELTAVQQELGESRQQLATQRAGHERVVETREAELRLLRNQISELRIELDRESSRLRASNAGLGSRVQELLGQIDGLVIERDEWRSRAEQEDAFRRERQALLEANWGRNQEELDALGTEVGKLQRLLDQLPCAVLEVDGDGCCTGCNGQVSALFGEDPPTGAPLLDWLQEFAPSESWARQVGRRWNDELYGDAAEAVFSLSDQQGLVRELELRRHPRPDGVPGALLVGCDISELQTLRRRLDQLFGRYRVVYELGALGLAVVAPERGIVEVNPLLARVLGQPRRDLLGTRLEDWFSRESAAQLAAALDYCHDLPEAACLELSLRLPGNVQDGVPVKLTVVTVAQEERRPLLQFCLLEDIHGAAPEVGAAGSEVVDQELVKSAVAVNDVQDADSEQKGGDESREGQFSAQFALPPMVEEEAAALAEINREDAAVVEWLRAGDGVEGSEDEFVVELDDSFGHAFDESCAANGEKLEPGGDGEEWSAVAAPVELGQDAPSEPAAAAEQAETAVVEASTEPLPWRVVGQDQVALLAGLMQMESRQVEDARARELLLAHSRRLEVLGLLQDLAPAEGGLADLGAGLAALVRLVRNQDGDCLPVDTDLQPEVQLEFSQVQRVLLVVHELLSHLSHLSQVGDLLQPAAAEHEKSPNSDSSARLALALAEVNGTVCLDLIDPLGVFDQRREPLSLGLALGLVREAGGKLSILPGPQQRGTRVRILLVGRG